MPWSEMTGTFFSPCVRKSCVILFSPITLNVKMFHLFQKSTAVIYLNSHLLGGKRCTVAKPLLVANKIAIIAILIMVILLYNWWQLIVLILFTLILSSLVKTAKQKCMKLNSNYKNFSRTVKCQWCKLYKQKAINLCFIPHSPPPSLSLFFPKPLRHNGISQRWWRSTQRWQADLPSHSVCRRHQCGDCPL